MSNRLTNVSIWQHCSLQIIIIIIMIITIKIIIIIIISITIIVIWGGQTDLFFKSIQVPASPQRGFPCYRMEGIVHEYIPFNCPIINKLAVGRELTKIYNIMYNIYSIHLAFISFIYVTGMGSITFSVEQIGDVLKKKKIEDKCKNTRLLNICFTI